MKEQKVVYVSLHQAVKIGGDLATNLSCKSSRAKYRADMTIIPELQCVKAMNKGDIVLIPFTNCAVIKLDSEFFQKKEEAKNKEAAKPKSNPKLNMVKKPR